MKALLALALSLSLLLVGCTNHSNDDVQLTSSISSASSEIRSAADEILVSGEMIESIEELDITAAASAPIAHGETLPALPRPDDILDQMFNVDISFVIPFATNIDDPIKAELIITPEDLQPTIEHSVVGLEQDFVILVTQVVRADLRTDDFDVINITPIEQALSKTQSTQWLWKLRPLRTGNTEVILTVTAIVKTDFGNSQRQMKAFEKSVDVTITKGQVIHNFINENWQWLLSTLFIPFALLLYRRFRNNSK